MCTNPPGLLIKKLTSLEQDDQLTYLILKTKIIRDIQVNRKKKKKVTHGAFKLGKNLFEIGNEADNLLLVTFLDISC